MKVLGLMSGTSADGVDAVLLQLRGRLRQPRWRLLGHHHHPYSALLRDRLTAVGQGAPLSAQAWLELQEAVTEAQASCARQLDPAGHARLVGCHGQTVWHRPPCAGRRGVSCQLLLGPLLARLLERPVVFDFRANDLARGGQGAPLVPLADAALLGRRRQATALLNLGGIANLTLIPPRWSAAAAAVRGWDCGPANSLLDLAAHRLSAGRLHCDEDGRLATGGVPVEGLIRQWLQEPYFQQRPPKSTGRDCFGADDLARRLGQLQGHPTADVMATLTHFSAAVVAQDLAPEPGLDALLVAGGGVRNPALQAALRERLAPLPLVPLDQRGLPAVAREAAAFALLAWWRWQGVSGTTPLITGADRPCLTGTLAAP